MGHACLYVHMWQERASNNYPGCICTQEAIAVLPDDEAREMCVRYATLEQKMGEIDRARAIYAHAAQFSPPSERRDFWQRWHEFELRHGNPDTSAIRCIPRVLP